MLLAPVVYPVCSCGETQTKLSSERCTVAGQCRAPLISGSENVVK